MNKRTPSDKPDPGGAEPVGTPPHGGRWTWDSKSGQWQQLPDTTSPNNHDSKE